MARMHWLYSTIAAVLTLSCLALIPFWTTGSKPFLVRRSPHEQFQQCMQNSACTAPNSQLTNHYDFLYGKPTRLSLAASFWSKKRPSTDLTIVTGLTVSRLDQLEAQCSAWRGHLVAAVYLPLYTPPSAEGLNGMNKHVAGDAAQHVEELYERLEADASACALDVMLLIETFSQKDMQWMIPINVLRNYALTAARTTLVAMVDVDLVPSASINWILSPGHLAFLKRECSNRKVFVLPAFATNVTEEDLDAAHELASTAAAATKPQLYRMWQQQQVQAFHQQEWPQGHGNTDYQRWFSSRQPYTVNHTYGYEPWFIADRRLVPFYDSRFRGYGVNKVLQVAHVHDQGCEFVVHPHIFLVHRAHETSEAHDRYMDSEFMDEIHQLQRRATRQMMRGTYEPPLDEGVRHCLKTLTWWKR